MIKKAIRYFYSAYVNWNYPNLLKVIRHRSKIVAYYGYLDDYNYGDIMVYQAAEKLLSPDAIIIPMKRRMPLLTKLIVMGLTGEDRKLVMGGGTLMGSTWERNFIERFTRNSGGRIMIHGTGSTSGIVDHSYWSDVLSKSDYGGVRGKLSKAKIEELLNLKVDIIGDAAFGLFESKFWENDATDKSSGLLINMGTHHNFSGMENSREITRRITELMLDRGERVTFLPMHQTDVQLASSLKEEFSGLTILKIPRTIEEAIGICQKHDFAFGERLHFIVLAIMAKTPFLSVNYRPKHEDLLETVNLLHAGFDAGDVTLELVEEHFADARANRFNWSDAMDRLNDMRDIQIREFDRFSV